MSSRAALIAIAENPVEAAIWVDALRAAGIAADSYERFAGVGIQHDVAGLSRYMVLADATRLADARNVITEFAGASRLAPIAKMSEFGLAGTATVIVLGLTAIAAGVVVFELIR